MSEHTKEPWSVGWGSGVSGDRAAASCYWDETDIHYIPISKDGKVVCWIAGDLKNDAEMQADARRIVACVNACRGLRTDELEQHGIVSAVGCELMELEQQRDELLAAAKKALGAYDSIPDAPPSDANINRLENKLQAHRNAVAELRAAISKAEGVKP